MSVSMYSSEHILLLKIDEKERLQARVARMINGLEGMAYCMKRD